jgi:hypothetical protein
MSAPAFSVEDADALAARLHAGVLDRNGEPYIEHPRAVAALVAHLGPVARIAALLHDTVEDCGVTFQDLLDEGVPADAVDAVDAVTRRPGETYAAFIDRAAAHPVGRYVKRADLRHNTRPDRVARLRQADPAKAASLAKRYARADAVLAAAGAHL